ncbi:Signal transduction histidine kinase [uncultured Stenotrophomonas sp.]|uniref:histidine kinase n=1 Tax=uncultured Stenotrophomonas sp. TaxID=165438 RepID=A0A1Y5Q329_9GAMM|nr:Signal transduction histidine kinase [uncultured Stenotrophomonas sp.]
MAEVPRAGFLRRRWQEAWAGVRLQPWRVTLIAAPWLLGLLTALPLLWYETDRVLRVPERQASHDAVQYAAQSMLRWMERLSDDARFLALLTPRLLEDGSQAPLVETYGSFLRAGSDYHKVRWLDAAGHERLRLDQDGGDIRRVPVSALQDKQGRPFFENALALQPGQVHLSPLDLNVENGGIEQPLRPTLRASSPFVLGDGSSGVVVLNLHGRMLLERLREQAQQSGFTLYLVHPEGYWLIGPQASDAWGWQLGHRERNVAAFDPALWRELQQHQAGYWQGWSFSTLETAWGQGEGRLLAHADPTLARLRILVHRVPPQGARWQLILVVFAVLGLCMVAWVVLGQARGLARETAYVQRLRDGNAALALANERLLMAQQELARAERLSSLGLMVAGVAHEMNTPLASAQLALGSLGDAITTLQEQLRTGLRRSEMDAFLANATSACALAGSELRRSAALVQRFKQVAVDRASLERRRFDLAEVLLDADPRLRKGGPVDGVELVLELEPGVAMDSYPGPLGQVVANLFANALLHGCPPGGPGRIVLSARADGPGQVRIDVVDDGQGIAADDLPRIFEPFFTTRRNRGGTGLGLHIVHQIVTEVLGGRVEVHSHRAGTPGDGPAETRFTLYLPCQGPDRTAETP